MRRVPSLLLLVGLPLLAGPAPAAPPGTGSTLADLSRRAETIAIGIPLGSPARGLVRFRVAGSIRGSEETVDVRAFHGIADEFDPAWGGAWLLYLRRAGGEGTPFSVIGGAGGALPLEGDEGMEIVRAAADLAPAADLADPRLLALLLEGLGSKSDRVREDAAEELSRLPRPLLASAPGGPIARALEREEGPTPARASLLRLLEVRADPRDLAALVREVESGPVEGFPLLAGALRAVPGGAEAAVGAFDRLARAGNRKIETLDLLGRIGGPGCARPLEEALGEPDPAVRLAAIEGLAALGGPDDRGLLFLALAAGTAPERRAAARAILLRGDAADSQVLRAIADSFPGVRPYLDAVAADPFLLVRPTRPFQSKNR